jgi:uncharacterized membrane protein
MPFRARLLLIRLACLLALAGSALLYATSVWPASALGFVLPVCDMRMMAGFGKLLGVPVSLLGVLAFAGLFVLTLFPAGRPGRWIAPVAVVGGGIGVALLLVQFVVVGKVCPFCVAVDAAALLAAVSAVAGPIPEGVAGPSWLGRGLWLAAGLAAVAVPAGFWLSRPAVPPPTVPAEVVARWEPGVVTVVEVVDFRSHPSRRTHAALNEALRGGAAPVKRVIVPWAPDEDGRVYARAFHAARKLGKGEEMATALFAAAFDRWRDAFTADVADREPTDLGLTAEDCAKVAAGVGLSPEAYQAAIEEPDVDRQIDEDFRWLSEAKPGPLPVLWVQDQFKFGRLTPEALREALRQADQRLSK